LLEDFLAVYFRVVKCAFLDEVELGISRLLKARLSS
jgi:hypothetical protein